MFRRFDNTAFKNILCSRANFQGFYFEMIEK
jgi:hypothetical protein